VSSYAQEVFTLIMIVEYVKSFVQVDMLMNKKENVSILALILILDMIIAQQKFAYLDALLIIIR